MSACIPLTYKLDEYAAQPSPCLAHTETLYIGPISMFNLPRVTNVSFVM